MAAPDHIAIIMDGNGRWAKARHHNRFWGHIRGAKTAQSIIEYSAKMGVKNLTLFTFSTENWKRPHQEVSFLMHLLTTQLKKELPSLLENNITFNCIGDMSHLPKAAQQALQHTIHATKKNTGMNLIFALNYSGRQDITQSIKAIAQRVQSGEIAPENIDESTVISHLQSAEIPDPDLIIRTSGEMRISNFFLWQSAYSELYFCDKYWPEFTSLDLQAAIDKYNSRERRFGMTGDQIRNSLPPELHLN